MAQASTLTASRRGAWIINATKHLILYEQTDPRQQYFDNLVFAGKCGSLLIKLSADSVDQLSFEKVVALARVCGINRPELLNYITTLKQFGCLDWDAESITYEILACTRQRVLGFNGVRRYLLTGIRRSSN